MRASVVVLALLQATAVSCLQVGTGTGTGTGMEMGGGSAEGGSAVVSSLVAPGDGGLTGTNCFEDPVTKAVLCQNVGGCPGVGVDPGAFPDCGYRLQGGHGGTQLDLECLCGTALCPIGVPASCQQAKALLDAQNGFIVCAQQAEGRCVELPAPDAGPPSPCDPSCRDQCAGAPSCIQLCGC